MTQPRFRRRLVFLNPAALLLIGCTGTAPKASQPISLSITTRSASTPALPAASTVSASLQIGTGANSLTISQAQVVLARIELSPSGSCATTGEEDDCDELRAGPALVDLPVDGTTKLVLDGAVPPGSYTALHAKLDAVTADDDETGASAFLVAHPDLKGISVKVTGVFTDAKSQTHNFTFTSEADAEIEAAFQPAITVAAGTSNITVSVDVASWFKDETGAVIDPTDPANALAIDRNVRRSFRTFEDDDRDGVNDHQESGETPHP
jgi:hypothetical protein